MPHVGDAAGSKSKPLADQISTGSLVVAGIWCFMAIAPVGIASIAIKLGANRGWSLADPSLLLMLLPLVGGLLASGVGFVYMGRRAGQLVQMLRVQRLQMRGCNGRGWQIKSNRSIIAGQLQGLRDQVFALSNRKDTNGQPLFGALASALTPFVGPQGTAPDYTFKGLPGQTASSEVAIPFSVDGDSAFMHQPARAHSKS